MPFKNHIFLAIVALILIGIIGSASAASIGTDWKERVPGESSFFSNVMFSSDGTTVFAGGNQVFLRNWDGEQHWGGRVGFIATMSADGNYVVYGQGNSLGVLYKNGIENWTRNMDGEVRAVGISKDGTYVISTDSKGNINTWTINGELYARNTTDRVKQIAISPTDTLVVATTETGLKFFTPALSPVWSDTKNGSIDTDILFANDGSTIITAGGKRVSSHTNTGTLNWMNEVTGEGITGIASSYDGSVIVIGSQDGSVQAMDRYGTIHWSYQAGQWTNAVGMSRDANVIVAAGIDRNLYVLDHAGKLLAKKQMDTIIHPRTIAVSADSSRIAVADEYALYGLTLSKEPDSIELITVIPTSARFTDSPTSIPTSETTVTATHVTSVPLTTMPAPTKSPSSPVVALVAIIGGVLVTWVRRKS
ncbi:MAG: WD40 repeat domain-containing protein [Methanoregula sp.]|nr:WD40 repeat domain-containing protein [Methanoregula sp.]